ncbi:MAG: prenyltransferase/squalene oxidase repeat-containing protein, partial [Phycisphaerae bacterium]
SIQRVRVRATLTPLGMLQPQKLKVVKPLVHRAPERRKELVQKMGGSKITEEAVTRGLAYLARSQEPDGRWTYIDQENELADKRSPHKDDMGLTGLAVLCFLAADERPDKPSPYQKCVADGLAYLLAHQKADGDFRGEGDMYSHGIATLAMGEAAVMTRDPKYGEPAVRGARFTVAAQNPLTGGWRYVPGSGGDTSVMGWQIMALYSVNRLGIEVPPETRRGAMRWLNSVSRGRQGMLVGYQDSNPTRTMTAEALFVRLLLGQELTDAQIVEVTAYIKPPDPMEPPNFYGWYYGSLAMMQLQNEAWQKWNASVRDRLTAAQERGGGLDGSWDPSQSRWGAERGGRIYTTAVGTLTLEVYYRYLPMLARKGRADRPDKP